MLDSGSDVSQINNSASAIYTEYASFIRIIIHSNCVNPCQAEDIFQTLFMNFSANPIPNDTGCVESYLYRAIIRYIAENEQQARRYDAYIADYAKAADIAPTEPAPETDIINAEQSAKLFTLIQKWLTQEECKAITLRCRDNCKIKEAAKTMQVKARTVSSYFSRAIKKLRNPSILDEIRAVSGYNRRTNI